jgi:hypothetical protein
MRSARKKKTQPHALQPRLRVICRKKWIRNLTPSFGARTLELFGCQRDSFLPVNPGLGRLSSIKLAAD